MSQTTLIVILGVVAALLLVFCGLLFALYRKKQAPAASPTVTSIAAVRAVPAKVDTKNREHISAARQELKKIESLLSTYLTTELTTLLPILREQLSEKLKQGSEENFLEVFSYSISFAKAGDIRTEIERRCGATMETIFNAYECKLLPAIFDAVPDAAGLKARYELTQAIRAKESLNGQAALKRNLSPLYCELDELSRLQSRLAGYLPQLEEMKTRGRDWLGAVRSVAGGALAYAHPLVGIPALIFNWSRDTEKQKRDETITKIALNEFSDYLERWERLPNIYLPVCEEQRLFILEKVGQVLGGAIPRILADLDNSGYSLKSVPGAYGRLLQELQNEIATNYAT